MDKDLNDSDFQNSSTNRDYENEQSLVGKFKKNVSEIISNTPLSKWFKKQNETPSSMLRKRQDDSDDETDLLEFQPPSKRTKLPPTKETLSLNVSEVLSPISKVNDAKKPLYVNFPEPIPGPSGYQTRKMLNSTSFATNSSLKTSKTTSEPIEVFKNPTNIISDRLGTNANKDVNASDSEESTSGYSSGRIGSKEVVSQKSSKQTSPLENSPLKARSLFKNSSAGRSLFSGRTLSPKQNPTLSSRIPSFDPSSFGSPNFVDRTLSTKKVLNSPFYSGRTIYGGASAYGRSSGRTPQDLRKVLRQSVNIKPVNKDLEKGDLQLGITARRILDTLEQYSSPVSDAKKIPITSKKSKTEGSLTKYIGANPYTIRGTKSASNKELQVPSVTDFLKMKLDQQKSRLQDSTEAARQIATSSKSVLNETSYQLAVHNDKEKQHTGKIKTKITSLRQKVQVEQSVPELKLNPVALPIKEMPKFDFILAPPSTASSELKKTETPPKVSSIFNTPTVSKPITETKIISEKSCELPNDKTRSKDDSAMEFKFSAPLVLAECLKPLKALNNYKFSEPLVKKRKSIHAELNSPGSGTTELPKIKKNNGENVPNVMSIFDNKTRKGDSLMDTFKPKEGTWECSVCMIRNQSDKLKCAACETPRSSPDKTVVTDSKPSFILPTTPAPISTSSSFGSKFKAPSDTWECPTCMIRNKEDIPKCAACETLKPTFAKPIEPAPTKSTSLPSFGSTFAPPPSTWECSTCMIRNKDELDKCAACETQKPGSKKKTPTSGFSSDFKKKDDEWECEVCMVRNKSAATKCQCCESIKPGSSLASQSRSGSGPKGPSYNFGIGPTTASTFSFGIPPSSQTATPKTNAALVFGQSKAGGAEPTKNPPAFSFGVPSKASAASSVDAKKDFPVTTSSDTPDSAKTTISSTATTESATVSSGSAFAAMSKPAEPVKKQEEKPKEEVKKVNPLLKPGEKLPEKAVPAQSGFSFGLSKPTLSSGSLVVPKPAETNESPSRKMKRPIEAEEPAKAASFTFKTPTSTNGADKTRLSFGKGSELSKPAAQGPGGFSFNFASAPKSTSAVSSTTTKSTFTFGSTPAANDKTTPVFKMSSGSMEPPKSTNGFSFGSSTPVFGSKTSVAAPALAGAPDNKTFGFGGSSTPATNSTPSAAGASNPPPAKAPMFQFGGTKPENKTQTGSAPPSFSFNPTGSSKQTQQFSFGSATPAASNPPNFGFGQAAGRSAPSTSSPFAFGSGTAASKPEASSSSGGFGALAPATANHFGPGAKPEAAGTFGANAAAQNGLFNFGAGSSTSQKAMFSFGSSGEASGPSGSAPASTGFTFGADQTNPAATSGNFNFSSATTAFDANAKPMFNFTGGNNVPTFSAPPAQEGTIPKRIIRKAIRKMVR